MNRKYASPALAALAVTGVAGATSPHFVRGPTASLDNDWNAVVSWKEAGLGNNQNITYTASAQASARYQCVNHGGRCPAAANKQDVTGLVSSTGTFNSGKNGSITASLTIEPPATTLACPGNQVVALVSVYYTDIQLSDDTNNLAAPTRPDELSASGPECP